MKERITQLKQEAHAAFLQARGFAAEMAKPENAGKVAEFEQKFNAAHADGTAKLQQAEQLERHAAAVAQTEQAIALLERPAGRLQAADPREAQPGAGAGERQTLTSLTPESLGMFLQALASHGQAGMGGPGFSLDPRERVRFARDMRRREQLARVVSPEVHLQALLTFVRHGMAPAVEVLREGKVPADFIGVICRGEGPKEAHALMQSTADLGGFLVPDDFRAQVIRDLAGFAVIRPIARVERTGRSALVFPSIQSATTDADIYASGYTGAWKAEGYVTGGTAPTVQDQPKFGQERVPVHTWAPNAVEITTELLEDSAADLDMILAEVIAETKALDEDSAFINGNGVNKPLGLAHAGITSVNSGDAALITYDGLVDLYATLPAQYRQNARFLMSSLTYGAILKLKDNQSYPIITPNTLPGQLWGRPIAFSEFVEEVAASAEPIYFGDFRYFVIADRQELRLQRLLERFAPNVGILPTARTGGQVVRTAAFRRQTIAA